MCDPVTLAAASFAAQAGSAIAAAKAQNDQSAAVATSAASDLKLKYATLGERQVQEGQAAAQKIQGAVGQVGAASGTAAATAGTAGVTGNSLSQLYLDLSREGANYTDSVNQNLANTDAQLQLDKEQARIEALSRINSALPIDPLLTALRIGGAGVGAIAGYQDAKNRNQQRNG